jgi:hypothetical protein
MLIKGGRSCLEIDCMALYLSSSPSARNIIIINIIIKFSVLRSHSDSIQAPIPSLYFFFAPLSTTPFSTDPGRADMSHAHRYVLGSQSVSCEREPEESAEMQDVATWEGVSVSFSNPVGDVEGEAVEEEEEADGGEGTAAAGNVVDGDNESTALVLNPVPPTLPGRHATKRTARPWRSDSIAREWWRAREADLEAA